LVRWLLGGGLLTSLGSFLYPVFRFMSPPPVAEAAVNEVSAGKVDDLKPGAARIVRFGSKPVLLIRVAHSDWRAYSAVCTHLNCTVQFHEPTRQIWCACHNAFYDLNGAVVSGPPPRPLDPFVARVRGDEIVISRRS
jgi:cytochrome b6-f complex iron-sulfur subunit